MSFLATAGIQHKAREIELLVLKICCIYNFFWIPAVARNDISDPRNKASTG